MRHIGQEPDEMIRSVFLISMAPTLRRLLLYATAVVASLLIPTGICLAQAPAADDKTTRADASKPATQKIAVEERDRAELLKLIRELQDRVTRLEANQSGQSASQRNEPTPRTNPAGGIAALADDPAANVTPSVGPATAGTAPSPASPIPQATASTSTRPVNPTEEATWGMYSPGEGFKVASTDKGELSISGYMVARYLNQLPANQSGVDHLGRPLALHPRQDFQLHRVMIFFKGFVASPKFEYQAFVWTVNDTTQVAVGGALTYKFNKRLILGAGWNGYPGTRSIQGSHPYWTSYDRVMADEFFRPFFSQGVFVAGEVLPRLYYRGMIGNNLSNLSVAAVKLTRDLASAGSLTWMPTTGEFGPRGAFGDYENHQELATRFGTAYTRSREDRFSSASAATADNTTIRLGDSLNLFDTGSLAPGVTIQKATYQLYAADAGIKYRGFWLQAEGYYRILDDFESDLPLPVTAIRDSGFYVQAAYMIVPKKI